MWGYADLRVWRVYCRLTSKKRPRPQSAPAKATARRRKAHKWAKKRKRTGERAQATVDTKENSTEVVRERVHDAESILERLAPYVDSLPWDDVFDKDGDTVSLGRRSLALYSAATYIVAGHDVNPSFAVGTALFFASRAALFQAWKGVLSDDETFVRSQRGKHAKHQWVLDHVDTKLECMRWLDEHSNLRNSERASPATFAAYLTSRADELVGRLDGKRPLHKKLARAPDAAVSYVCFVLSQLLSLIEVCCARRATTRAQASLPFFR